MKRYIVMMAVAMAAICTSCSKDDEVIQVAPPTTSTNSEVKIKFSTEDVTTRAFFDGSVQSEAWEKSISKATLLIERYDNLAAAAAEKVYRVLTADEIAAGSVTVGLTSANAGDVILVAVGANFDIPEGTVIMAVESEIINKMDMAEYNGSFEQVSTGSMRSDGFVLFAYDMQEVSDSDSNIVANLQLERQIVKIAIQASISDKFNNPSFFAGDLRVDAIRVRSTNSFDLNFDYAFSHTQASYKSGDYYQNLFFIDHSYRNDFTVSATYDADGDFTTTNDQRAVIYVFSIAYDTGSCKELLDNEYYRITLNINSVESTAVDVSISVADWAAIKDQTVDIG